MQSWDPACLPYSRSRSVISRQAPTDRATTPFSKMGVPRCAGAGPVRLASGRRQKGTLDHRFAPGAAVVPTSELRAAVNADGIAGDRSGIFGCQKGDNATDVVGLRNSDDCDHPFRRIATSAARVQTTPLDD